MKFTCAFVAAVLLTGCPPDRGACYSMTKHYYTEALVRHCRNYQGPVTQCPEYERLFREYEAADAECNR